MSGTGLGENNCHSWPALPFPFVSSSMAGPWWCIYELLKLFVLGIGLVCVYFVNFVNVMICDIE